MKSATFPAIHACGAAGAWPAATGNTTATSAGPSWRTNRRLACAVTLYLLAATTGMRRGELAGLPWSNVDLDAARLTVNQQIVSVQYKLIEGDLKTPTSRRSIDLDPRTVAELRRNRRRQLEERMATGQRGDDGYVFAKPDGSPIHPDLISQTFERAVAKLDLPRIRLHDLRHTHATILLQQNVHPKVVSERLGHSSVALHHDRLPARHARPAGPSRFLLRGGRIWPRMTWTPRRENLDRHTKQHGDGTL